MQLAASDHLSLVLGVLRPVLDIVEGRVEDVEPPSWCSERGWADFLLSLAEEDLQQCEARGLDACLEGPSFAAAPASLRELARAVSRATRLRSIDAGAKALHISLDEGRQVPARKRAQLGALLAAIEPMARRAERIVDVGAGRGALTRLSALRFERPALGIERNPERLQAAERNLPAGAPLEFLTSDVLRDGLALGTL
ncbi:MAG: hypothetical protein QM756_16675 [Polyangiaceae bacterium]